MSLRSINPVVLSEAKDLAVPVSSRHPERSEGSSANGDSMTGRSLASLGMTDWSHDRKVLRFAQDDVDHDFTAVRLRPEKPGDLQGQTRAVAA